MRKPIFQGVLVNDNTSSQPSAVGTMPADSKILVWDLPLRVFHWLLAASLVGAWLTAVGGQLAPSGEPCWRHDHSTQTSRAA
jgi:hypothetical protein